jgi:uncharacterized RmlC-like cupin family protein
MGNPWPNGDFTFDLSDNEIYRKDKKNYIDALGIQQLNTIGNIYFLDIFLSKDNYVDLHYHPNASELTYCISGKAVISFINPTLNEWQDYTIKPGDAVSIPQGFFHMAQALTNDTHLLATHDTNNLKTVFGSDIFRTVPPEEIANIYCLDEEMVQETFAPIHSTIIIGPPVGCERGEGQEEVHGVKEEEKKPKELKDMHWEGNKVKVKGVRKEAKKAESTERKAEKHQPKEQAATTEVKQPKEQAPRPQMRLQTMEEHAERQQMEWSEENKVWEQHMQKMPMFGRHPISERQSNVEAEKPVPSQLPESLQTEVPVFKAERPTSEGQIGSHQELPVYKMEPTMPAERTVPATGAKANAKQEETAQQESSQTQSPTQEQVAPFPPFGENLQMEPVQTNQQQPFYNEELAPYGGTFIRPMNICENCLRYY